MNKAYEVNFDGLIGPTHNYSGLAFGDTASMQNRLSFSNPKAAALEGLEKMRFLSGLGIKQAILPPHERPHIPTLRSLGFDGRDADVISAAYEKAPKMLYACSSAAAMWTANAATATPSVDSTDAHVHLTPANLISNFHRIIEAQFTAVVLKTIFSDSMYFVHHSPLIPAAEFADEGAANHTRFCYQYKDSGIHLFVYGKKALSENPFRPKRYPARQTYEASQAIERLHKIYPGRTVFAQQHPRAIDAGVFHNDVAAVGNRNVFLYHEAAYIDAEAIIDEVRQKLLKYCDCEFIPIKIPESKVPLEDVVSSYLFNSQLISIDDNMMALIAPSECQEIPSVHNILNEIVHGLDNPIKEVHYLNIRESMRNGGGPACLRLRVVLNELELQAANQNVFLTEALYSKLVVWIQSHYRDRLVPSDLRDPSLLAESRTALDELTRILGLGPIYPFQQ